MNEVRPIGWRRTLWREGPHPIRVFRWANVDRTPHALQQGIGIYSGGVLYEGHGGPGGTFDAAQSEVGNRRSVRDRTISPLCYFRRGNHGDQPADCGAEVEDHAGLVYAAGSFAASAPHLSGRRMGLANEGTNV